MPFPFITVIKIYFEKLTTMSLIQNVAMTAEDWITVLLNVKKENQDSVYKDRTYNY